MKSILNLQESRWAIPVLFLGVVAVVYGYQLFQMGLYGDDWEIVYLNNFQNPNVYWNYFQYTRPLTGWLYVLMSPLIGMAPVAWQFLGIVLRWTGLVGFWWSLRIVWPRKSFEIGWLCLLLAVYPAFTQHSASVTFSRLFVSIALYTVSLGLNLLAVEQPKRWWFYTISAVIACMLQWITLGTWLGLELLRPFFLWVVISRNKQNRKPTIKEFAIQWLPYLTIPVLFAALRLIWSPINSSNPDAYTPLLFDRLASNPMKDVARISNLILQDLIHLNVDNWFAPISPSAIELKAKANLFSWGVGAIIAFFSALLLLRKHVSSETEKEDKDSFSLQAVFIGLIGLCAGGIPAWAAGRLSMSASWLDGFAITQMFGAVLILIGVVHWFSRKKLQQAILLGIVFGFAISSQMQTVNKYRLSWDHQKDFYWQLAWRAPAIKSGTAIVGLEMPFAQVDDFQVGFALNSLYDPHADSFEAPIWFFDSGNMVSEIIPAFKPGNSIDYHYQTAHFKGTTDQVLAIHYSYGTDCLRIAAPEDRLRTDLNNNEGLLVKLSDPGWIDPNPPRPMVPVGSIFGPEPEHGWCYSFQKMELARQEQKWEEAARLADDAGERRLTPLNALELTPAIMAYLQTGQMEKALKVSLTSQSMDLEKTGFICALWDQVKTEKPEISQYAQQAEKTLVCIPPVDETFK